MKLSEGQQHVDWNSESTLGPMASKHLHAAKPRPPVRIVSCMDDLQRERAEMARDELCCIACLLTPLSLLRMLWCLCCFRFNLFIFCMQRLGGFLKGSKQE